METPPYTGKVNYQCRGGAIRELGLLSEGGAALPGANPPPSFGGQACG